MDYLNFWQALTYRKATAKKTVVKKSMVRSCMRKPSIQNHTEPTGSSDSKIDFASRGVVFVEGKSKENVKIARMSCKFLSKQWKRFLLVFAVEALGNEAIAHPRFGLDELFACFCLKLFAKLAHKDAEILRLVCGLRSPHGGEQRAMGNDLAGMTREVQQEFKFFWRQVDGLAGDVDAMRSGVNHKVSGYDRRFCALGCATHMGADETKSAFGRKKFSSAGRASFC